MVGRQHRLAVDDGRDHVGQLALGVEFQDVGPELFADPEAVGDWLDGFDVEISACEVALLSTFKHDREGCLLVGIGQEQVLDDLYLAGGPVELHLMQEKHGVAGVCLRAEAIVGQRPERAVFHGLDAGEALDRLSVEGKLEVGHARAVLARNGAERLGALAVRRRELAGVLEELRCIGGSRHHGVRRQNSLAGELCGKLLLVGHGRTGDQKNK